MNNFIALNSQDHKNLKYKQPKSMKHTVGLHMSPVSIQEFPLLCHDYAIVFVKDTEADQFRTVALLGIKPKENLYYKEDGWEVNYIPEFLRQYPFMLAPNPNEPNQAVLCFDEDSDTVNENEGEPLFNEDGTHTEFTQSIGKFIGNYNAKEQVSIKFAQDVAEMDLLETKNLELNFPNGEKLNLTGLHLVSEEKLNNLSNEDFLKLKEKGYLVPIYAQLLSVNRFDLLMRLAEK